MNSGTIRYRPPAYMLGRSLMTRSCILDEEQNNSAEQIDVPHAPGWASVPSCVTGDVTQSTFRPGSVSGLRGVQDILDAIDDIHFARLTTDERFVRNASWSADASATIATTRRPGNSIPGARQPG